LISGSLVADDADLAFHMFEVSTIYAGMNRQLTQLEQRLKKIKAILKEPNRSAAEKAAAIAGTANLPL
ncbi:hypothetical protein KGQ71_04485, partial [Patescibacteria group bacterium]|nr:hypothetical protein [Patescibacteria group bacterium]